MHICIHGVWVFGRSITIVCFKVKFKSMVPPGQQIVEYGGTRMLNNTVFIIEKKNSAMIVFEMGQLNKSMYLFTMYLFTQI